MHNCHHVRGAYGRAANGTIAAKRRMLSGVTIYKIATREQWTSAQETGVFVGAPVDLRDGYIHFSTETQVAETLAKHFAGQRDLLLLTVEPAQFGDALRWEVSRGGQLFPHLYAPLPVAAVRRVDEIVVDADGRHVVDELFAGARRGVVDALDRRRALEELEFRDRRPDNRVWRTGTPFPASWDPGSKKSEE